MNVKVAWAHEHADPCPKEVRVVVEKHVFASGGFGR